MSRFRAVLGHTLILIGVVTPATANVLPCSWNSRCFELRNVLAWDPYLDTRASEIRLYFRDPAATSWTRLGSTAPAVGGPTSFAALLLLDTTSPCTTMAIRYMARAATPQGIESSDSEIARARWILWHGSTLRDAVLCATAGAVDVCVLYPCGCAAEAADECRSVSGCVCVEESSP